MYPCSTAFQRQRFPLLLLRQQNSDKWIPGRGWQCRKNIDLPCNPIYPNLSCISHHFNPKIRHLACMKFDTSLLHVCVGVYLLSKTIIYLPKAKSLCILAQLPFKDIDPLYRYLDNKIVTSGSLGEAGNAEKTLISFITQFIQIYHAFPFVIYYIGFPFLCFVSLLCFLQVGSMSL